jgi:nucleosome binding factor SPN SPT16 subunit
MMDTMEQVCKIKLEGEQNNLKLSGHFIEWTAKKLIKQLEDNIDGSISISHFKLASLVENWIDNPDKIKEFNTKYGYSVDHDSQLLDYPLPVQI